MTNFDEYLALFVDKVERYEVARIIVTKATSG